MSWNEKTMLRVAVLDLYDGVENQGMRCIKELLNQFSDINNIDISIDIFDVRRKNEVPNADHDVYISSGGPGSPIESEGTEWENNYFAWIKAMENYNDIPDNFIKKQILFICHSFQLANRYFGTALVSKRKSTSFGVYPMHYLPAALTEPMFQGLSDPFFAVDSRDYQVTEPNHQRIAELGGRILAIEKARPHIPLERAIMCMRFRQNMIGTQFHPEADAIGMSMHLQMADRKKTVIENHGEEKWASMIVQLNDPEKISHTYSHIIPNFLQNAVDKLQSVEIAP